MAILINSDIGRDHYSAYNNANYFEVESDQAAQTNFRFKVELEFETSGAPEIVVYYPPTYITGSDAFLEFRPADIIKRFITETSKIADSAMQIAVSSNGWVKHRFRFYEVWDGSGSPANVASDYFYAHNSVEELGTSASLRSVLLSRDTNEVFPRTGARQLSFFIDPDLIGWYFVKATIFRGSSSRTQYIQGSNGQDLQQTPASGRIVAPFNATNLGLTSADTAVRVEAVLGYSSPGTPPPGTGTPIVITSAEPGAEPKTTLMTTAAAHGFSAGQLLLFTYTGTSDSVEGYYFVIGTTAANKFLIGIAYENQDTAGGALRADSVDDGDLAELTLSAVANYIITDQCYKDIIFKNRLGGFDKFAFRYVKEHRLSTNKNIARTTTGYLTTAREGVKAKTYGGVFVDNTEKVTDLILTDQAFDENGVEVAVVSNSATLEAFNSLVDLEVTLQQKYLTINE